MTLVGPTNTHPVTLTTRGDVINLVCALTKSGGVRAALAMANKIDAERVDAGGELDTLPTSLRIMGLG